MLHYRTTTHSKYDLKVHLVWVPKYRKRILIGEVGIYIRDLIRQICTELDVEIINGKLAPDHVHLFLSYPPYLSISELAQKIKGKSSYKILANFSHLRKTFWGRHFWARGYFAASSGNVTDEMIQAYIEQQDGEIIHHGPLEMG
ncbi:MAG: IS200/IS605 family transposase [bacterium]|nr:IS200/IS605 family transposase [bacterium]